MSCSRACMTALIFLRLDLVSHMRPWRKRSSGRSSSWVRQISQRSLGPWQALQKSRTSCAGTMWSKLLKMKRTGRWALSFLRTLRQSMAKRSKPSSSLARCSTRYSSGRSRKRGSCTLRSAMRWTTPLRQRKGESSTSAPTSQAQALANMSAQRLPMERPQRVTRGTRTCRRTSSSTSRMSNTSFTPQLSCPASLFPHPSRSKAARLHANCGTSSASGIASSLDPPLPCRQRMVSAASSVGQWKRNPSRRLPLRLRTERSTRTTVRSPTCRSLGPSAAILHRICCGEMMLRHASSKRFISGRIQIRACRYYHQAGITGRGRRGDMTEGRWRGNGDFDQQTFDGSVGKRGSRHRSPTTSLPTRPTTSRRIPTRMHELQAVSRYYGINHPILSASKKRLIEEKLKLDEQVRFELHNRRSDDNLFAKFHRNPFSFEQDRAPSANDLLEEEQRRKRRTKATNDRQYLQPTKDTIVTAVNELTQTSFVRGQPTLRSNASYSVLSSKMIKNVSESQLRCSVSPVRREKAREEAREVSLEDILEMSDQNFFAARQGSINIFQVMRGTHRPFLTRECLDKLHFHFTHLVDRVDVVKFPLLRDLSRVGRDLVAERSERHNRLDFISSSEMAVKYGDIRVGDLLSIASGRFSPEIAYAAANQGDVRKDFSPTSSEVSQAEILYASRARHKQQNCQNPQQPRHEIEAYQLIEHTPEEARIERFCGRVTANVKSDLDLRRTLVKNTIQDRRMHGKIEAAVQENISYLANLNKRRKDTPTDRTISQNKVSKNRKERLQIKHLLQSIQLKNREEEKIRELLAPTRP